MQDSTSKRVSPSSEDSKGDKDRSVYSAPQISLPKGGGAIRGIGEKFTANPATGTGSLSVPIATSPGRAGFGPQLGLSYDSGAGNGSFGIGWNLSLPAITRKTDKGLPQYRDVEESDVFILSGMEDLVTVFRKNPDGSWARDKQGNPIADEQLRDGYRVRSYRPRIEGLFARIERWTRLSDGDTHWRSISKDNVLTVYGDSPESRIADPANPSHVFSWLICRSYDDKGNAIAYEYVAENGDNVDLSRISERNRVRSANRYLKTIRYGNRQPVLIDPAQPSFRQPHVPAPDLSSANWMFEVVFDYGEGHYQEMPADQDGRIFAAASLKPPMNGKWPVRLDPFSTYRSCFEVRSYRLCRRVLLFHHFPDELGVDDYLVRSTEFTYLEKPNGSFISQVLQSGFKRIASPGPRYLKRSLPPLDFGYSVSPLDDLTYDRLPLQEVDSESLENLPSGIDSRSARWVDLDGEGISGVLSESADAWYYKPNLGEGHFGPVERVSPRPAPAALNRGRQQLLDLAGDGNLDLVTFEAPTPGYFSRTDDAAWDRFRTFKALPDIDWKDPNLRFVDLTGDGHADILVTDDEAFSTWHESFAEEGFGPAVRVPRPFDEEEGPRLVLADGTQSIYLADMSGDGLSDLVRIRKSEVCYWPNIGYGRFGPKVTMDNAPWFDDAESFDERLVHLTDTDGSGPTDIVYLGRDGVRIYLNQHGNSLSEARLLSRVPRTDDHASVSVVDLLGRGTACLLWSSPMPGDARRPLRYLDLMGGIKPHLLTLVRNNLGAETRVEYASSTHFYLEDKKAGTPWITRLPFPVHVLSRVETNDWISGNRFVTRYAYHHGYFDGIEREFRGFGRVDQWDTEEFGIPARSTTAPPSTNLDAAFHVPPILTKTWFHTGAYFAGGRVSRHFEDEYYREGDPDRPEEEISPAEHEAMLLDDTVLPPELPAAEMREAIRSLKGAILRQEIYALDGKDESDRPYSVSERNYTLQALQPRGENRYSVFFTHARETIEFKYERKLYPVISGQIAGDATAAQNPSVRWRADPRVSHAVTLDVDEYGNVRQSVAIAYGRRFDDPDPVLTDADRKKQKQLLVTLTEASFTNAVFAADANRAPLPAEVRTYELLKIRPAAQQPGITNLFRFAELVSLVAQAGDGAHDLPYEDVSAAGATEAVPYRRPIEHLRTRYRSNNLALLLPLKALQTLAITGESYKLGFTPGLLSTVYQRPRAGQAAENLLPNPGAVLPADGAPESDRGGYVDLDGDGRWWMPSGRVFFHLDENATAPDELTEAASHFFQPRRFRDPFLRSTIVDYAHDLLPAKTRDALGNTREAVYDYRAVQPKQIADPNGNRSFVVFDAIGLPVATAARGKISETVGDSLDDFADFDADPALAQVQGFVARPREQAASMLKGATSRVVYDLDRFRRCGEPPLVATLARETHLSDPLPPQGLQIQVSFAYSDGFGREIQSKIQAEPGDAPIRSANVLLPGGDIKPGPLTLDTAGQPTSGSANPRWVGKGRTVFNNKGKPVKQYEPFFSGTHLYEMEREMTDAGVASTLFYDPMERVVLTLHPSHNYQKEVFDPWRQESWDVNDTVAQSDPKADPDVGEFFQNLPQADYLPTWYEQRRNGQKGSDEKAAADKAASHAATPSVAYFDTLGRAMLSVADNGIDAGGRTQKYATRVALDIEGNEREVTDASNRIVVRHDYDMLGNCIRQSSMEAGQGWMLNDATGKSIRSWDSRGHSARTEYDELRRPVRSFVTGADAQNPGREIQFEETIYGESTGTGLSAAQVLQANLRGKPYQHYDTGGVVTSVAYDFKGNLQRSTRQLAQDYKITPDWSRNPTPALEIEVFSSGARYDALNRPIQIIAPHGNSPNTKINLIQPGYNEANLLDRLDAWLGQPAEPSVLLDPVSANLHAVTNIDFNARGQRTRIEYGNGALTEYAYDDETFRLLHLKTSGAGAASQGLLRRLIRLGAPQGRSVLQDLFYTYDPAGNITHIRDDAQQAIYFSGQAVPPQCDYTYDAIYRLIQASGREHIGQLAQPETTWNDEFRINLPQPNDGGAMRNYSEQYLYDAAGNFEKLMHQAAGGNWTRAFAYNEPSQNEAAKKSNRLSNTAVGAAVETYTYDEHGNMTNMPHLTMMHWDFKDQLSATSRQAVNPTSPPDKVPETTYYVYEAGGERVRKVTERENSTRREERIYVGGFEIYRQFSGNGNGIKLERETLHLMDDKQRIALVETRTLGADGSPSQLIRYQFGNHLGSASLELDDVANIISYEEYFPYGGTSFQAVNKTINAAAKRYRYTAKERDEETGFAYHGARYCAPWLGRWVSPDPVMPYQAANLYAYGANNPLRFTDPHGTTEQDRVAELLSKAQQTYGKVKTQVMADVGDVANYSRQGVSRYAEQAQKIGRLTEAEHPVAGAAVRRLNPAYIYRNAKTVVVDRAVAVAKTAGDRRLINAVKSGTMGAAEFVQRSKANFVKAVAARWAQTGSSSASKLANEAKQAAEVTEEAAREALPSLSTPAATSAARAGQRGSAELGLMKGIAGTGFAVVTGVLSYQELRQDLKKKDYASAIASGSGVAASGISLLARGASVFTGVSSASVALTTPLAGMGAAEGVAAAPHVVAAFALGAAGGVAIEHYYPEYTKHTADVGSRVEKASGSTIAGGIATVGTTLPLFWAATKVSDYLTNK